MAGHDRLRSRNDEGFGTCFFPVLDRHSQNNGSALCSRSRCTRATTVRETGRSARFRNPISTPVVQIPVWPNVWVRISVSEARRAWQETLHRQPPGGLENHPSAGWCASFLALRITPHIRYGLSARGVSDHFVTQMLRQGGSDVFKRYRQAKLTMMREAMDRLDRSANEHDRTLGHCTISKATSEHF